MSRNIYNSRFLEIKTSKNINFFPEMQQSQICRNIDFYICQEMSRNINFCEKSTFLGMQIVQETSRNVNFSPEMSRNAEMCISNFVEKCQEMSTFVEFSRFVEPRNVNISREMSTSLISLEKYRFLSRNLDFLERS